MESRKNDATRHFAAEISTFCGNLKVPENRHSMRFSAGFFEFRTSISNTAMSHYSRGIPGETLPLEIDRRLCPENEMR